LASSLFNVFQPAPLLGFKKVWQGFLVLYRMNKDVTMVLLLQVFALAGVPPRLMVNEFDALKCVESIAWQTERSLNAHRN
jgi:hypothetical protein